MLLSLGWLRRPGGPSRNLASRFVDCVGGFETLSSFAPQPAGVGRLLFGWAVSLFDWLRRMRSVRLETSRAGLWTVSGVSRRSLRSLLNQPKWGRVRPDVRRCWGGSASRLDDGSGGHHGRAARSRWSSDCFTSVPQAKPPSEPSDRNTRWHGTNSAGALRAQMEAAARTARGVPKVLANSA